MNITVKETGLTLHFTLSDLSIFCTGISLFFCPSKSQSLFAPVNFLTLKEGKLSSPSF